jgi:hypothetical protein
MGTAFARPHQPSPRLRQALWGKGAREKHEELQHSDQWFRGKSPEGFVTLRAVLLGSEAAAINIMAS